MPEEVKTEGLIEMMEKTITKRVMDTVLQAVHQEIKETMEILRGPEGKRGIDGQTPRRGVDFLTDEEVGGIKEELRPKKDVDFFDGRDGESIAGPGGPQGKQGIPGISGRDGKNGKDGTELKAEEIRDRLQGLKGFDRLDASAIKNLPKSSGGVARGGGASVRRETPSGAVNGVNTVFTLAELPRADDAILLFVNGQFMTPGTGNDYTRSDRTLTLASAPQTGANIRVWYLK